ncbi:MAG: death-on-curing family protein [Parcubacteria group bacterium Gr01-1014_107]|nr:MAG: death-on-curing family protein [Parcubacteria group bacterium Gr01-1014_107]
MKELTVEEVKFVAHKLAQELMSWNEPIPDFTSRFPNALESCLLVPFQTFGGKKLYKGLVPKAAVLFYLMIKNHPFENGNKRIAVTTLLYFLFKNRRWIKVDNISIYNFAVWVAESPPIAKTETIAAIETFLKKFIIISE